MNNNRENSNLFCLPFIPSVLERSNQKSEHVKKTEQPRATSEEVHHENFPANVHPLILFFTPMIIIWVTTAIFINDGTAPIWASILSGVYLFIMLLHVVTTAPASEKDADKSDPNLLLVFSRKDRAETEIQGKSSLTTQDNSSLPNFRLSDNGYRHNGLTKT